MNRPNLFPSNGVFRPPTHFLNTVPKRTPIQRRRTPSLDDSDIDAEREEHDESVYVPTAAAATAAKEEAQQQQQEEEERRVSPRSNYLIPDSSSEQSSVPLVRSSRLPSPFTRNTSPRQPDHEEAAEFTTAAESRPLIDIGLRSVSPDRHRVERGGITQPYRGIVNGETIYSGSLICCVGICQSGLLLVIDFVMKEGLNKFAYPLTLTLIQLVVSHLLILATAAFTRRFEPTLQRAGVGHLVAPTQAPRKTRASRYKSASPPRPLSATLKKLTRGQGGITGGGMLEWQQQSVKHALPAAVVFTSKLLTSNLSYAYGFAFTHAASSRVDLMSSYTVLPTYMLSRIAVVPLTLVFTAVLLKTPHSAQTLSSTVAATLALFLTVLGFEPGPTWGLTISGALSSVFSALYPIVLLRTYKQIASDLVPHGQILMFKTDNESSAGATKETIKAYWRTLHYISMLSILVALPIVLVSGELWQMHKSLTISSAPWFWMTIVFGGALGCAVFSTTLLLVKATSPLTANVIGLPRSAMQLAVVDPAALPTHSWISICACWACSIWYMFARTSYGKVRADRLD